MAFKWKNGKIKRVYPPQKLPKKIERELEKYWEETVVDMSPYEYIQKMDIEIVEGKAHCFQPEK